ncbi:MAG: YfbU family protein [Roseomonas sp.]|nr:YfbU family protein [Roseomonas sp.]
MKLSAVERQILWNQMEILRLIHPSEANSYKKYQEILDNGYVGRYRDVVFLHGHGEVSQEDTDFVTNVLDMFSAIKDVQPAADEEATSYWRNFRGFCGNHEAPLLGYARFLIETEGRWASLEVKNFDSHMPVYHVYKRMLEVWSALGTGSRYALSREQVANILMAAAQTNVSGP